MATNGILKFQGTNKATFVGATSNVVIDTVKSSLGIGVDVNGPTSNLHVVGNVYVSTELTVGGTVTATTFAGDGSGLTGISTSSTLQSVTDTGNVTSNTIQFTNATTGFIVNSNSIVTGNVTAATFLGDGSGLTSIPAAQITGTLDAARIPALDTAKITTGTLDAARIPTLNQNTTGSAGSATTAGTAATLTTARTIGGVSFDGSAAIVPTTFGAATFSGDVTVDSTTFHVDSTNNKVGIGTISPKGNLHIKQNDNDYYSQNAGLRLEANGTTSMWAIVASSYSSQSGTLAFGSSSNGAVTWADRAYISHVGNQNQLDFTGQHRAFIEGVSYSDYETLEGLIVSANKNKYYNIDEEITTGASAIQVSQSLPLVSMSTTEKDKSCFGVISGSEDPETREYTQGSFVSVMKKQVGDIRAFINSVGEGAIWVTNINGPLESGDYITTSNVAGYGQKQDSEFLANYTVAKITMDCDFSPVTQPIQNIKKDETGENTLDEHGQIQWEDHPTETEKAYKIRHLDANGVITDEANVVHTAAFVGCTYHCG